MQRLVSRWCVCLLVAMSIAAAGGCGGESVEEIRGAVKGKVTLDGQPVKQGSIRFIPTAGTKGPEGGSRIQDGVYSIELENGAAIGKNRVEITANKPTGKKVKSAMSDNVIDETEEAIPERYNKRSTLAKSVEKGTNEFDFDLKSK